MGRGNYLPNTDKPYKIVYIHYPAFEDDEQEFVDELWQDWYEDLKVNIISCLPKSFKAPRDKRWGIDDNIIIAANGLYDVLLADNEWSIALVLIVNDDNLSFAGSKIDGIFNKLLYKLWEMYDLNFRSTAWTSSEYFPSRFRKVSVYDNGGKTADRYTVSIQGEKWNENFIYGMNDMPFHPAFGFSQFVGENLQPNKSWGKKIRLVDLNEDVLNAIEQRM